MSGKGSSPRPFSVSQEEYHNNYDRIFGKKHDKREQEKGVSERSGGHSEEQQDSSGGNHSEHDRAGS